MNIKLPLRLLVGLAALLGGCHTAVVPLKPVTTVEEWVTPAGSTPTTLKNAATATAPATQVATSEPATTSVTTAPGLVKHTRVVDPNQTVRYVYRGNYQHIWQEATALITHLGYTLDRQDYRLGIISTKERIAAQVAEPWRRDQTTASTALENTVNEQRRKIRLTIRVVEDRPEFYEIAVQVIVERLTNPQEKIGRTAFARGSGFGASAMALQSDYLAAGDIPQGAAPTVKTPTALDEDPAPSASATAKTPNPSTHPASGGTGPARWVIRGRDPRLEQKILRQLLDKI